MGRQPQTISTKLAAPKPSWRTQQEKKSRQRFFIIFLLIVGAFFIGNLFVQVPRFVKKVEKPFSALPGNFANSKKLDLSSRASLLLLNFDSGQRLKQAWIATYDPNGKRASFVILPIDIPIATQLDRELTLSELTQKNVDRSFWEAAVLAGTTLNGYLAFSSSENFSKDSLLTARKNVLSFSYFLNIFNQKDWLDKHLKTNLSVGDLFAAARVFKSVNLDSIDFITLEDSVIGGRLDNEKLTNQTKPLFVDSASADEAASVKIVNGSRTAGLGTSFKRVVTNLGGIVVGLDSEKKDKTVVFVSSDKKKLASKIAHFLGTEITQTKSTQGVEVTIILGADLAEKLNLE